MLELKLCEIEVLFRCVFTVDLHQFVIDCIDECQCLPSIQILISLGKFLREYIDILYGSGSHGVLHQFVDILVVEVVG